MTPGEGGGFLHRPVRSIYSPSPGQTLQDVANHSGTSVAEIRSMNPQIDAAGTVSPDMRLQV